MKSGIYQILNLVNGKRYIGSAVDITARWWLHKRHLTGNVHHSIALQRAWNKYREENFKFEILLTCEKEELIEYEQLHFDELKPEYNICKVAGSMLGYKHSKENCDKISKRMKGTKIWVNRKHREDSKLKMSESAKANPQTYWQDKTLTEAHKDKIAVSHTGLKQSAETVAKRVAKTTGQTRSAESLERMSKWQKGIPKNFTEEQLARISESSKGRIHSPESLLKRSESMKKTLQNKKVLKEILTSWGCAL